MDVAKMDNRSKLFAGEGARKQLAMERVLQNQLTEWSTKHLIKLKNQWLRDQGIKKTEMVGSYAELKRLLKKWHVKAYQDNYKAETGGVAIGVDLDVVLGQAEYQAGITADSTYSRVQAEFYDSTRKLMSDLKAHQAKYGIKASGSYIRRQLEGLPGPSPYKRAGVPEPPSYRFKGKKLRTFGTNGVNGSRDPYAVAARARVIARTEITQARNEAKQQGFEASGVKYKMWISFHDKRTRKGHRKLDGKVVIASERFEWKSERGETVSAMAPGDVRLPAGERINCRCTIVPARKDQYDSQRKAKR